MDIWVISSFLAPLNHVAMHIHVQVFVWTHAFNFLEYRPRSGIAAHMVTSLFCFLTSLLRYNLHTIQFI